MLRGFPLRFTLEAMNPRSNIYRALEINPSSRVIRRSSASTRATSKCRPAARSAPPARSRTRTASSPLADASWGCGRRRWTCWRRRRIPPARGFYDECLKGRRPVLAWLHEAEPRLAVRQRRARSGRRAPGGSLGFADPDAGVGYAYVTSQMGTHLTGDPRDVALRDALYAALPRS